MARLKRLAVPGLPHYVLQRGRPDSPVFVDEDDARRYLELLQTTAKVERVDIHAFALLPHAVHLLVTPATLDGISRLVQGVGRLYVAAFNRRHQRAGSIWQGRFVSAPVEPERTAVVSMMRFVEQAPLREGLVTEALDHRLSSARHHAGTESSSVVVDHPMFWALGNTPFEREAAYKALLGELLSASEEQRLSRAGRGWAIGSPGFVEKLGEETGRRAAPGKVGRPRVRATL
jgi:putative transposase